ncbi:toxin-antitoxin system, antitoxin component, ribbon-helix-helix domain protein [Leptospira alstonii serovar Pingchang str. 80-412]|uniref:Toxin-antitoxin system, antitoxin component, ribbon-helix-helix domain protein n=2 Tax=Leptospira alstonii TaxID=28452 RepID=M6D154_9LEPT|nr:toxin-antitoxin system, antitoxin component, ribbon-helix-helix domain protein [Leptospira alstonii serovar Sichuan str. 79601]EQA79298.1 toxin-antitoxin system, antitoxin component, ribbon-helix-helix domain protein [Leptospira alstonii serovar Pingchang str. 80-412]
MKKRDLRAASERKSLTDVFNEFLKNYSNSVKDVSDYENLLQKLNYVKVGRKFTREEMNER